MTQKSPDSRTMRSATTQLFCLGSAYLFLPCRVQVLYPPFLTLAPLLLGGGLLVSSSSDSSDESPEDSEPDNSGSLAFFAFLL